jgi:adenylate cyclase
VVSYFQGLRQIDVGYQVALYRTNGIPAFSDNETIREVNENINSRMFSPDPEREEGVTPQEDLPELQEERFAEATAIPPRDVLYTIDTEGGTFARMHRALINLPKCAVCHGSDHTLRGVIDIQSDVTESVRQQRTSVVTASLFFLGLVLVAGLALSAVLRKIVITPVQQIGAVCEAVTKGDFDRRVTVGQDDEIGRLGTTVNEMVQGLKERFHLSRFVSGSTIRSIQTEASGGSATATLLFADIRGFTAYTEGYPPETVVATLNSFLNLQSEVIAAEDGDIDKYVGDEVVALFTGEDAPLRACRAAAEIQARLRDHPIDTGGTELQVGIGVHQGEVIMGAIGSENRADFTAIGDNMNTAARLCSAAAGGETIVSKSVRDAVYTEFDLDGPYRLRVKGKREPLRVYKLTGGSRFAEGES